MADKVAKEDITVENDAGQTVVVVHAGQVVPDDIDDRKMAAKDGVIRTATAEEIAAASGIRPVEDKARRSSRGK